MRPFVLAGAILLLSLGLAPGAATAQETEQAEALPSCGDCHEQAAAFTHNPHARGTAHGDAVANAVCESCHGDGTAHIEAGGDPTLITVPKGRVGAEGACLQCHDTTTDRRSHRTGAHATSEAVNCFSCHSIHHAEPRAARLLKKQEPELCSSCHGTQTASLRNKPYAHKVGHGGMECSSCHEPHGRTNRENLRRTAAGEAPCLNCHTNLRGPHVFEHGGKSVNDCMTCHEPHGSNNPRMLKRANVWQLCLECHTQPHSGAGSQPPSFHSISTARFQNCTTCHVAVHGSNRSPALLK